MRVLSHQSDDVNAVVGASSKGQANQIRGPNSGDALFSTLTSNNLLLLDQASRKIETSLAKNSAAYLYGHSKIQRGKSKGKENTAHNHTEDNFSDYDEDEQEPSEHKGLVEVDLRKSSIAPRKMRYSLKVAKTRTQSKFKRKETLKEQVESLSNTFIQSP